MHCGRGARVPDSGARGTIRPGTADATASGLPSGRRQYFCGRIGRLAAADGDLATSWLILIGTKLREQLACFIRPRGPDRFGISDSGLCLRNQSRSGGPSDLSAVSRHRSACCRPASSCGERQLRQRCEVGAGVIGDILILFPRVVGILPCVRAAGRRGNIRQHKLLRCRCSRRRSC